MIIIALHRPHLFTPNFGHVLKFPRSCYKEMITSACWRKICPGLCCVPSHWHQQGHQGYVKGDELLAYIQHPPSRSGDKSSKDAVWLDSHKRGYTHDPPTLSNTCQCASACCNQLPCNHVATQLKIKIIIKKTCKNFL